MTTNTPAPRPFTAGGLRFRPGQRFTADRSRIPGLVWVIEGSIPDYYGRAGRSVNLIVAHQEDRPGVCNVFAAAEVTLVDGTAR